MLKSYFYAFDAIILSHVLLINELLFEFSWVLKYKVCSFFAQKYWSNFFKNLSKKIAEELSQSQSFENNITIF
jgi:hypothetical protein